MAKKKNKKQARRPAPVPVNIAAQYCEAVAEMNSAKARAEALKAELLAMLDSARVDSMTIEGYEVKRYTTTRNAFDSKAFRIDHDDLYSAYRRPQSVNHFSVTA